MLAKRIIPCLDVTEGRVVKGIQYENLRDAGDPVECAAEYDRQGADELTFLDITASTESRPIMLEIVCRTAEEIFIPFTVGGGIRTVEDIRDILRAGADKCSIMTASIKNSDLINEGARRFGNQCIVVAIDAKRVPVDGEVNTDLGYNPGAQIEWRVHTHGGSERTDVDPIAWAKEAEQRGAGEFLVTSMDADGTREGYDIELLRRISSQVQIPVIASGGAGNAEHMYEALTEGEADAVLAASIFHFGQTDVQSVKEYLAEKGVEVRL